MLPVIIRIQTNEFSLLVMDSDDDRQHFDYKEIVKKESKKSKKLRKKLEKAKTEMEENFKVDLDDARFSAVFQNADYNVDPSHPNFKTTKSMLDIVAEKQRRVHKRGKQKSNKHSKLKDMQANATGSIKDIEEKSSDTQNNVDSKNKSLSMESKSDINKLVRSVQRKSKLNIL